MSKFQFEWKTNRNFCVTGKFCLDFETAEADNGKFHEFALKNAGYFTVLGYYKTKKNAVKAMVDAPYELYPNYYFFMWNRAGECIDGVY